MFFGELFKKICSAGENFHMILKLGQEVAHTPGSYLWTYHSPHGCTLPNGPTGWMVSGNNGLTIQKMAIL